MASDILHDIGRSDPAADDPGSLEPNAYVLLRIGLNECIPQQAFKEWFKVAINEFEKHGVTADTVVVATLNPYLPVVQEAAHNFPDDAELPNGRCTHLPMLENDGLYVFLAHVGGPHNPAAPAFHPSLRSILETDQEIALFKPHNARSTRDGKPIGEVSRDEAFAAFGVKSPMAAAAERVAEDIEIQKRADKISNLCDLIAQDKQRRDERKQAGESLQDEKKLMGLRSSPAFAAGAALQGGAMIQGSVPVPETGVLSTNSFELLVRTELMATANRRAQQLLRIPDAATRNGQLQELKEADHFMYALVVAALEQTLQASARTTLRESLTRKTAEGGVDA